MAFDDAAFGTSRLGPSGDVTAPTAPTSVTATATSAFSVHVDWSGATDDTGVTGYDVYRDGNLLAPVDSGSAFTDTTALPSSTYHYAVRARDLAGNVSPLCDVAAATTSAAAAPQFSDGFETGDLSGWTSSQGLAVQQASVHAGSYAAEGSSTTGVTWAKRTLLACPCADAYARVAFLVQSQGSQTTLLRLRDTPTGVGGYVYLTAGGRLAFRSDALASGTTSSTSPGNGWHVVELHLQVGAAPGELGTAEVWLDGGLVADLSSSAIDVGSSPIGTLQVGDTASNGTGTGWDVVFDDAGFGTSRLGPAGDTSAPTVPGNVSAVAGSPFAVHVSWDASTDDTGVTGYDLYRDGALWKSLGTETAYDDTTVLNSSTHHYAVRARDLAANVSALSPEVSVTTPDTAAPVFADGFESGDLSGWTSTGVLAVESADVRSGGFAAEGVATNGGLFAKKTLPGSYVDAYARVGLELKTLPNGQTGLLRLRDTAAGSVGNVFLTSGGKLGFSAPGLNVTSVVALGTGWHVLELHVAVNGTASSYQVWLDGAPVTGLSGPLDLTGSGSVTILQVGDSAATTGRTYDVVYDDAAFSTSRVGI